ncbi:MAG: recombinase [Planctomycetes bacterium]|nr:recombinase [Planctomycetota bacterium]
MTDFENYEKKCAEVRETNGHLLKDFEAWLVSAGLSEKTRSNHLSNIKFYVNDYLLYEDTTEAKDGMYSVSMFLGYWFIKKAMWASPTSVRGNAASLKKFYTFMHEKGLVEIEGLTELKQTIKEELPEWLATLERYDDLSVDDVW